MSNIYIQEPHTSGKVILHTTAGDIAIELFSKEAPKACRNFVQLALEGQYDSTIFHRVVPGFIIQGGDPAGTGFGGDSIYGGPFEDEFHSRLRFVRRGLVAMANSGKNDNRSQFFITLDRTDELQNKHTIFGTVVDETVFNVLKIGELETDENERPLYPPKIISTEVVLNPFDDIVPRITLEETLAQTVASSLKEEPPKKKPKKNIALLSFGEEAQELDANNDPNLKIKSSHDLLENDPRLSKEVAVTDFKLNTTDTEKVKVKETKDKLHKKTEMVDEEDSVETFNRKMKENVRQQHESTKSEADKEDNNEKQLSAKDAIRKEIEQVKQDIKKLDRSRDSDDDEPKKKKQKTSFVEVERQKYLSSGKAASAKRQKKSEDETLKKLKDFQSKLFTADPEDDKPVTINEDAELCILHSVPNCLSCRDTFGQPQAEDTDEGWLSHRLVFEKDYRGKDLMQRRDDPDDYVVIDPLERKKQAIEEEKEKRVQKSRAGDAFNKDNKREWDKERNRDSYHHREADQNRDRHGSRRSDSNTYGSTRDNDRHGFRSESDRHGSSRNESDRHGSSRNESDRHGSSRSESDRYGSSRNESDRHGSGRSESDKYRPRRDENDRYRDRDIESRDRDRDRDRDRRDRRRH
ncbi:cyclophilin-like protein [Gigaspora margarita]|uniref:Peptidyl-prolyl isomerase CWC27 n=1 Tax=Gigaspora margarita TaxID=4874 RepID=A0A8H4EPS6_GIGMA|nr:cyclophilin-like protein [Gigaspora margarita]